MKLLALISIVICLLAAAALRADGIGGEPSSSIFPTQAEQIQDAGDFPLQGVDDLKDRVPSEEAVEKDATPVVRYLERPEIRGDGMGWISMAPTPDGEPDLVRLGQTERARYGAEWSVVPWQEAYARRMELRKGHTRRKGAAFRETWKAGEYDVFDARGFSGALSLADLPAHYQGSFWKYQRMEDATLRVSRLPYERYKDLYHEFWEAEGIVDPHRVKGMGDY